MNNFDAGNAGAPKQPDPSQPQWPPAAASGMPEQPYPSLPAWQAAPSGIPEQARPSLPRGGSAASGRPEQPRPSWPLGLSDAPTVPQQALPARSVTPPRGFSGAALAPRSRRAGRPRWLAPVSFAIIGILLLGGIGGVVDVVATNNARATEQADKAALDGALSVARTRYNVPPPRLKPVVDAEQRTLAGMDSSYSGYQAASARLVKLTQQVNALTSTPPARARSMAQDDLTSLSAGVSALASGNFIETPGFQQRLQQAQTQFAAAATTPQYFAVDTFTLDQLEAVKSFQPTYQRLQDFSTLVQNESKLLNGAAAPATGNLQCAQGLWDQFWLDDPLVQVTMPVTNAVTTIESRWPDSDLTLFRAATTSADFAALNSLLTAQTQQTLANETALLPGVAANLLQRFNANITLMKQQKQDTTTFEQLYAQDQQKAQSVAAEPTLANYTAFVTVLRAQNDKIALPLIQAKTNNDLAALNQLIAQGQAAKTVDPANGIAYPNAYEYTDPNTGVGDATQRLANAQTVGDYQLVDQEILMFTANITAMLQDMKDPSFNVMTGPNAYWLVPHATDLQLIKYYGVGSTRVIVVSMVEQAARLYENGKFVKGFQVTTGAPDLPSVPGIHCVLDKLTNTVFTSPDPPGSPNYYLPTPIKFAMDYSYYGYALHDAWWRNSFGRFTNLPHWDPAAFNGGSHGCINFNQYDIPYVFDFASVGTPIIVY